MAALLTFDPRRSFQRIDGFGVNINPKMWMGGKLAPVVDMLIDDLGATIFRMDIFGKCNWAPGGGRGVFGREPFLSGWALGRHLNARGLEPVLLATGDVPRRFLKTDGKTLRDYTGLARMLAALAEWMRHREHIRFRRFSPFNEPDLGSPEGVALSPAEAARLAGAVHAELAKRGLGGVELMVPEPAGFNLKYLKPFMRRDGRVPPVGCLAMHNYGWNTSARKIARFTAAIGRSRLAGVPLWMTEYGDLDQSGEKEWPVAWIMTERLFDQLGGGFNGACAYDAVDNYHDHDECWTIFGLVRFAWRIFTPKKRYYAAKQVFRFVRPGSRRVQARCADGRLRVLGFILPAGGDFTVTAMNRSERAVPLSLRAGESLLASRGGHVTCYTTTESADCAETGRKPLRRAGRGLVCGPFLLPPRSIATLTTLPATGSDKRR